MLERLESFALSVTGGLAVRNGEILHGTVGVSTEIQMGPKGYGSERGELIGEEKRGDRLAERRKRID